MINSASLLFSHHLRENNIPFVKEHIFHPTRKWRLDFAILEKKIGIEIDGGVYTNGRHTRGAGYVKDCEKCNNATLLGWLVLRFPTEMVMNGDAIDLTSALYFGKPLRKGGMQCLG